MPYPAMPEGRHPAIFLTTHPFFEEGAINGRKQANGGFMRALLDSDPFDAYEFYVHSPHSLKSLLEKHGHLAAVRRHAVTVRQRTELVAALQNTSYTVCHVSDPVEDMVWLAVARNQLAPYLFPLTAPNHTLSYARYASCFQSYIWDGWSPRDAIGCNSTAARDVLRQYFMQLQTSPCHLPSLEVIPMGATIPTQGVRSEQGPALRRRLGVDDNTVLLLLFGRMSTVDKMDPLPVLLALRRVRQLCPQHSVALLVAGAMAGADPVYELLSVLAKRWQLSVSVIPDPDEERKEEIFAAADIFVSPSDNIQETFGLTLVEAYAHSLPVIASAWDGYKDIVDHMVTGILVPTMAALHTPLLDLESLLLFENQYHFLRGQSTCVDIPALAEAIALLAADPLLRQRMGSAGRERWERRFTWQAVVHQWLNLWENLRNRPMDQATEERLRHARHPHALPFGSIFSFFASAHLHDEMTVVLTETGIMLLRRQLPWETFSAFRFGFPEAEIRPLLVHARHAVSLGALRSLSPMLPEMFERAVLWCLKHDLLQRTADSAVA